MITNRENKLEFNLFINKLEKSGSKIEIILQDITEEQARWKPDPAKWSILEVINHLYDEESRDFRKRFDLTLHHPGQEWPGIDPEGWVLRYEYNQKDFQTSLTNFKSERKKSINWLRNLTLPDLEQSYYHPKIGKLAAGDLLAAWVAHDYLHLRQLANLQAQYLNLLAEPYSIRYASP